MCSIVIWSTIVSDLRGGEGQGVVSSFNKVNYYNIQKEDRAIEIH